MTPPDGRRLEPSLIYVPGMDGTGQLFYRQVPSLSRTYHVVTAPLRDGATSMDELMDDLRHTIALTVPDGEPVVLVGESFGGALAMSFALAHPQVVRALVILNSFPYFAPQFRLRLAIAGIRLMPWGAMRIVRRLTAWRLHSRHTHTEEMRRFLQLTGATTREGYLNRLRILTRYDIRAQLGRLAVPTLFLAADLDHLIPSERQARLMAARMPRASVRVLAGHGHSCFLARSLDLHEILAAWAATAGDMRSRRAMG